MSSFEKPECPYCKKKVDLLTTWSLRRQGEYRCPRCRGVSTIVLDMKTPFFAVGAIVTAVMVFLVLRVVMQRVSLWNMVWVLLPFLIFYILSIFLVRLKKPVIKKVPKKGTRTKKRAAQAPEDWGAQDNMEQTKVR